ncbi:MAG TPA: hypothetical protein VGM23_15315 [Armatimonadota bacterium]|jgi:ABC-type transport system involved in multi-copper enzyme maturation permease subunit
MAVTLQPLLDRAGARFSLPVLMKEMRTRMRGWRTPVLLFLTTGIAILIGLLILSSYWENLSGSLTANDYAAMAAAGRALFTGLVILEAVICLLFAPALTAGAITLEREHQTLDLLFLSRLSNISILLGKLLSSISFLLMLLLCVLPVMAISFILGGVAPAQVGWSFLLLLSILLLFGMAGLFSSSRLKATSSSVVVAYGCAIIWTGMVPALIGALALLLQADPHTMDVGERGWYYGVMGLISALYALIPIFFLSAGLSAVLRRPVSIITNLLLWVPCTVAAFLIIFHGHSALVSVFNSHPENFLVGNPAVALVQLLVNERDFFPGSPSTIVKLFIPITVGVQLLGALAFAAHAATALRRQRQQN